MTEDTVFLLAYLVVVFLVAPLVVAAIVVPVFLREKKRSERLELQQKQQRQQLQEAEILRTKLEEEKWQEDIRTGKVDFVKAEALYNTGTMLLESGKYYEAIEQFTKAIDFNPRYKEAYCNRGIAYKKKGSCDKAIEDYNRALKFGDDPDVHYNKGLALLENKDFESARSAFHQAIHGLTDYNKKKPMALLNHGIASYNCSCRYNSIGSYYNAIYDWKEVLKIDPNNSEAQRLIKMAEENRPY